MTDADLLALNVYEEAGREILAGQAAVVRVVKNRMRARFFSDGTVTGTILAKDQFSWAYFSFVDVKVTGTITPGKHVQKYVRLNHTITEAQATADRLFKSVPATALARCGDIAAQVMAGTYYDPLFAKLGNDAVSYVNPRILTKPPNWAIPSKFLVSIGHHDFYRT